MNNKKIRMELLRKSGINTNNFFSLDIEETSTDDLTINIDGQEYKLSPVSNDEEEDEELLDFDEIEKDILKDGYVKNTKLHRRWVMAQTFRMLTHESYNKYGRVEQGWKAYVRNNYKYEYQFKMLAEEYRVQGELFNRDRECFEERNRLFPVSVAYDLCLDYINQFIKEFKDSSFSLYIGKEHFGDETTYKYEKVEPIFKLNKNTFTIERFNNKLKDLASKAEDIRALSCEEICKKSLKRLNDLLLDFNFYAPRLETANKCLDWEDCFKASGAFYTLKNMIMFHKVSLENVESDTLDILDLEYPSDILLTSVEKDLEYLNRVTESLEKDKCLWRLHSVLVEVIESTGFDFKESIEKNS